MSFELFDKMMQSYLGEIKLDIANLKKEIEKLKMPKVFCAECKKVEIDPYEDHYEYPAKCHQCRIVIALTSKEEKHECTIPECNGELSNHLEGVNKSKFKVGQWWETRFGNRRFKITKIEDYGLFPIKSEDKEWMLDGYYKDMDEDDDIDGHALDLVKLIEDVE